VDVKGDSINTAIATTYDNVNGTNHVNSVITDLQSESGLTLTTNATMGNLEYQKDKNGNPIITTTTDANGNIINVGSATARQHLISMIDNSSQTVNLGISPSKSLTQGNNIWLDPAQIKSFIKGSVNLDNRTLGWGMTFLHESYHTTLGGNLRDVIGVGTGNVVDNMNIIRAELNAQGGNFGQRMQYEAMSMGFGATLPFDYSAFNAVLSGWHPALGGSYSKYIKF
jgi:hypothetical protein